MGKQNKREQVRRRLKALGLAAPAPRKRRVHSRDAAIATTRGAGTAASDALRSERARR